MNWVASIDKNQINLNVLPPTNVSLNLKMWTKTTANSAEVSTNVQHELTLNLLSFQIIKGPGNITVGDAIIVKNWDIYFDPGKPLKISIEVEAKEEDEGKPLVVTRMKLGRYLTDEKRKEPGEITCK